MPQLIIGLDIFRDENWLRAKHRRKMRRILVIDDFTIAPIAIQDSTNLFEIIKVRKERRAKSIAS